jgi:hypothetical protein
MMFPVFSEAKGNHDCSGACRGTTAKDTNGMNKRMINTKTSTLLAIY